MVIGLLPIVGGIYDVVSLALERDLISGRPLTTVDRAIMSAGLLFSTLGFVDEALEGGSRLLRHLDEVDAAGVSRGLSHLDEATAFRLGHLDEFTAGDRALLRGEELRRALGDFDEGGALRTWQDVTDAWARAGADLNDPAVRRLIQKGIAPIAGGNSIRYAPALESGLPRRLQRTLVESLDEGGIIAVRPRPYRAAGLEWKYPPKEPWVADWMVAKKYKNGVRVLKPEYAEEYGVRKVLSDLDIAGYTVNGRNIGNQDFLDNLAARFNEAYGYDIITHGPLVHGLNDPKVFRKLNQTPGRIEGLLNEEVYIFNRNGFIEKLPYREYEAKYIGSRIEIYGFRGTGRTAEEFIETEPLIYAGHVGISFDRGKTIYGFTPHAPGLSSAEIVETLKQKKSFPGQVLDDTAIFHRAQDLAEQGYRTQVYVQSIPVSEADFNRIRKQVLEEVGGSPLVGKRYAFPGPKGCFNCATWPASHGIPIPEPTGQLRDYIPRLMELGRPWRR
jgi:hypothetical protein